MLGSVFCWFVLVYIADSSESWVCQEVFEMGIILGSDANEPV